MKELSACHSQLQLSETIAMVSKAQQVSLTMHCS